MSLAELNKKQRRATRRFGAGLLGVALLIAGFVWAGVLEQHAYMVAVFIGLMGVYDLTRKLP